MDRAGRWRSECRVAVGCVVGLAAVAAGCGPASSDDDAGPLRLVDDFASAVIEDSPPMVPRPRTEWRFDGAGTVTLAADEEGGAEGQAEGDEGDEGDEDGPGAEAPPAPRLTEVDGFTAVHGIEGLRVEDGLLRGTVTASPALLAVELPADMDRSDLFHALHVSLAVSEGTELGLHLDDAEELEAEEIVRDARRSDTFFMTQALSPGDEPSTTLITAADTTFSPSFSLGDIRRLVLRVTDVEAADFVLESVRLETRKEHLASVPSGLGWHGLGDVYRETVVSRAPERIRMTVTLPARPWLDLALGAVEDGPLTFRVELDSGGAATPLLTRTLTTPDRWEALPLDLSAWAGRRVTLSFSLEATRPGVLGFWGGLVVRSRGASPAVGSPSPARAALVDGGRRTPRGVILIITDTLRRDHLPFYGYERDTAPVLSRLAEEGAVFADSIAQGTWTKVSVPSILTSLYPTTHGVVDIPDRVPATVQTLAESFQSAGYATFATSSVAFSGKLSNLHQGVEVMHESASLEDVEHSRSKTARRFTDRLLEWIERQQDGPFYARLHVFDPHSPFEPYRPWDTEWAEPGDWAEHEKRVDQVREHMDDSFMKRQGLPSAEELAAAGVEPDVFVAAEIDAYDGSIRGMDAEIGRLLERLEELGLARDTLVAVVADHGEEFLEHGRHWHGNHAYGEMVNVPMLVWWPGVVPAGVVVEDTVQSIDLMPTLLDLGRLAARDDVQGRSLVASLAAAGGAGAVGWQPRPAFSERRRRPGDLEPDEIELDQFAVVWDGWKLVHNVARPEGWPEFELFDHRNDPLDLVDVAEQHPERVEKMAALLSAWRDQAEAARVSEADAADLSAEERARLQALGYVR